MSRNLCVSRTLFALVLIAAASGFSAATPRWSVNVTGSLAAPREAASTAVLGDGNVLVFGGPTGAPPEVYETSAGTFSALTVLDASRSAAGGAALDGAHVLLAGGSDSGNALDSAAIFDEAARTVAQVPARMSVARIRPMVVRLSDGRVLVAGGRSDAGLEVNAELFNPMSNTFGPLVPMAAARDAATATLLTSGAVLFTGGEGPDGSASNVAQLFDPATGAFSLVASMTIARRAHQASLLADGRVLIAGGYGTDGLPIAETEVFDPSAGTFSPSGRLLYPRAEHAAVALPSGDVMIVGGRDASDTVPAAEIFNPASASSSAAADLVEPRWNTAAAVLADGDVLVTGGRSGAGALASSEIVHAEPQTATATMTVSALQRQYSDRVTLTATVTPADAARSVTFKIGTQVLGQAPVVAGTARLDAPLLGSVGLGVRIVTADVEENPYYEVYPAAKSIGVLREDGRVALATSPTVYTGCATCSAATLHIQVNVTDISVASPSTDADAGDIGLATVSFVNRATGAIIQTVPVMADPKDRRKGTATIDWPVNIGRNSSQVFTVGAVLGNYYVRNSSLDDVKVTVVKK